MGRSPWQQWWKQPNLSQQRKVYEVTVHPVDEDEMTHFSHFQLNTKNTNCVTLSWRSFSFLLLVRSRRSGWRHKRWSRETGSLVPLRFICVSFHSTIEPVAPFRLCLVFHSVSRAETETKRNEKSHSFFIYFALNSAASFGLNLLVTIACPFLCMQEKGSAASILLIKWKHSFQKLLLSLKQTKRSETRTEWECHIDFWA